jgi:hypothetical protein
MSFPSFPPTPNFFPPTPTFWPSPTPLPTPFTNTTTVSCKTELSAAAGSLVLWLLLVFGVVYYVKYGRSKTSRSAMVESEKRRRVHTLNCGEQSRLRAATMPGKVQFVKKPLERFVDWFRGENDLFCIWFPSVLDPLDRTQRSVVFFVVIAFLFAVSSFWSSFLEDRVNAENKWLRMLVNVLLTTVLTTLWGVANRKAINYFAITERFPLLHSPVGRMLPSLVALTLALTFDVLCFVFLFADTDEGSCSQLFIAHIYPFLANLIAHYFMPGIPIAYVMWAIRNRYGIVSDGQAELETLFNRLQEIAREQDGLDGSETKEPLLPK